MNKTWKPVTESDQAAVDLNAIAFVLTPAERDIAVMAMTDIIAAQRRANFNSFTPGLVVTHLQPSDLTDIERKAFGIVWGAK